MLYEALSLPGELRIDALNIQKQLEPFRKKLRDAGAFYLKYFNDSQRSILVSALVSEYLGMQAKLGRSAVHLEDLRHRYKNFCADCGTSLIRVLEPEPIESWLHGLELSPQSVNNYRARLSGLFGYAAKRKYLDRNWIADIEPIRVVGRPPEIFTVDELRQLLDNSPAQILPAFCIGAFAGLRSAELTRLEWSDIDLVRGFINVPAAKSKTAQRRLIVMAPNLREWLAPFVGRNGRVWANSVSDYHHSTICIRKAAGLSKWPKNGLRHSFASYFLAKHQDAAKLALDMGHEGTRMIFSAYREIVTPDEAARYWEIRPAQIAGNIVQLAAACA